MKVSRWNDCRLPRREWGYYGVSVVLWSMGLMLFYDRGAVALWGSLLATVLISPALTKFRIRRELLLQQRQLLGFLQNLSASIESGRSMEEGIEEALERLRSQEEKNTAFMVGMEKVISDRRQSRDTDIRLLEEMAEDSPLDDLKDFVRSYSVCRRTGGDLEQAIGLTCQVISEKMKLHQELQVLSAQKRLEARMISMMPILVLGFLRLTSPEYIKPLYQTNGGVLIMTLAILAIASGYIWTDRIMEVKG